MPVDVGDRIFVDIDAKVSVEAHESVSETAIRIKVARALEEIARDVRSGKGVTHYSSRGNRSSFGMEGTKVIKDEVN